MVMDGYKKDWWSSEAHQQLRPDRRVERSVAGSEVQKSITSNADIQSFVAILSVQLRNINAV